MKYALLGNGFDLHHNLPTKYIDILHIFNFWTNHIDSQYESIGELINAFLQGNSEMSNIKEITNRFHNFYNTNKEKLDSEIIDISKTKDFLLNLKNSFWFSYFINAKYEDIGWIDFESEIHSILKIFKYILENHPADFTVIESSECPRFKLCICETNLHNISMCENSGEENIVVFIDKTFVNRTLYKTHEPYNAEAITKYLYEHLEIIEEAICFYLNHFINIVVDTNTKSSALSFLEDVNVVVTLNYTNTFEKIYNNVDKKSTICHYHGQASDNNIVLGINSTTEDELEKEREPNTTFIVFKKYYQRILKNCDADFLPLLEEERYNLNLGNYKKYKQYNPDELMIVGHSLDITDRDIIKELFSICGKVCVYYHSVNEFGKYIKNLTQIFGKTSFEEMRKIGKLEFAKLGKYKCINNSICN